MRLADLRGRRVAILGYGREGTAAVALLREVFPQQPLTVFTEANVDCSRSDIDLIVGPFQGEILGQYEVLIRSPGVSLYRRELQDAQQRGAHLTSGSALWFAEPRSAQVIAVSGSKGKSTTCALIQFLLDAANRRAVLAGNIGVPLLQLMAPLAEPDVYVVELSSYQTVDFDGRPEVAVLTNLVPEHLDWHGDVERYYEDKLKLFAHPAPTCLVNGSDGESRRRTRALTVQFFNHGSGWQIRPDGAVCRGERLVDRVNWQLPGLHNRANLAAALAAVDAIGVPVAAGLARIERFRGLPHRLELVVERAGLRVVDDSIATTPYATIAALQSYADTAVTVLVGGYDRGLDWSDFATYIAAHPVHLIICRGANGARIAQLVRQRCPQQAVAEIDSLTEAVKVGLHMTPSPGVLLLSPGAPSFGEFKDFTQRGRAFRELAQTLLAQTP